MRHQRVQKKFGRSMEHRKALMKSLVTNLILAESIKTTLPKAKEARKDADKRGMAQVFTAYGMVRLRTDGQIWVVDQIPLDVE